MSHYARVTLTVVAVLALVAAAWTVRSVLVLVLVAAVLAVGLDPAVRRLERWRIPRGWAVLLIILAVIGFLVLFSLLVVPPLVREIQELARNIPEYVRRLQARSGLFADLERRYEISERLRSATQNLPSLATSSFGAVLGLTRSVASFLFNSLTVFILTVYFLLRLPSGERLAASLFTGRTRDRDVAILDESMERIGGYVSGNLTISLIAGITSFVALSVIGVPFSAAMAMWVAIADLIPTVGATLGAIPAVAVAGFGGLGDLIPTVVYFAAYQQVENYLIAPRVMAKAIDLTPAAVLVSVLIGGTLAGFAGALLALPLAAAVKVVIREVWLEKRLAEAAE